jgi:hypothetical protein
MILELAGNEQKQNELKSNISKNAVRNADELIAHEIFKNI